jgi:hypothetical protein
MPSNADADDKSKKNYRPERIPPGAEPKAAQKTLQAALDVIRGVHRSSKAAQRAEPVSRQERSELNDVLRIEEEAALRKWAFQYNLMLDAAAFTREWEAQGQIEGAEHQLYINKGIVYKRNNLSYHGNCLEYLVRLALHHWLFPDTAMNFEGLMEVDGELQAIVTQKAFSGVRGATLEEVSPEMHKRGFQRIRNNDFYSPSLGIIVEDLHDENVMIDEEVSLIIFDPVIYLAKPESWLPLP